MKKPKIVYQLDEMDCGPSCLATICKFYKKKISLSFLREKCFINKTGVNLLGISQAANEIGFDTKSVKVSLKDLKNNPNIFPCVLHWNQSHFVVLYKIKKNFNGQYIYYIADPSHGYVKLKEDEFKSIWTAEEKGIALLLTPTVQFYNQEDIEDISSVSYFIKYLKPFKKKIYLIFITLFLSSVLTFLFPFLTQKIIDEGIKNKNLNLVSLLLLSQLSLFFGSTIFEIIRNRIFLLVGTRININIISDFLEKLMTMSLKYFETKKTGDLIQRIYDHKRIEEFLTSQSIMTLFSLVTFSVFFGVLMYYSLDIVVIYVSLTLLSLLWTFYFFEKRKQIDYHKFRLLAESQNTTYEMITSMSEIKLNGFEAFKKNKWENTQENLFKVNIKSLTLDQYQLSGFDFLNNFKNIIITFFVAQMVIKNQLTLGALVSISFIVGEMNNPIKRLITFFRTFQDAQLSFNRLNEIHNQQNSVDKRDEIYPARKNKFEKGIILENVSFQYYGPKSPFALNNISLVIPRNKVTAIVGESGSGKTTLLKLLLKYNYPTEGMIFIDDKNLNSLLLEDWRNDFGIVMQEGLIFSETIERNIATSEEEIDYEKLYKSIEIANLTEYIQSLPLGIKTKIGSSGIGVSGGQKQRLLIARSVYKNPDFIFFDEATSSLDAENEKKIINNLDVFFKNKTVIVIAHRLSTVKNADQIVVLKKGEVSEIGTHKELLKNKSTYYSLIKNQLELDN